MPDDMTPDDNAPLTPAPVNPPASGGNIKQLELQDEMRTSYLTYAMSVIVSRALPDVRDGLKPSQRRILVAMNDLNLSPGRPRTKCAKIAGETMGNYHPHGDMALYPTLVRMAQEWAMRETLVDKQGNFGSLAGLPPASMRYTEARLSAIATEMLDDLERRTVDFTPTYNQEKMEPVVLPSRFPNLLVNGATGIAVGMATSIPPHNLAEVADAVQLVIDNPDATIDEIMDVLPGPDFPTGGIICGKFGTRMAYQTGRSTITLRAKTHFEVERNTDVIVVTEIPYMETRDRIKEKLEAIVSEDRIKEISKVVDLTDRNVPTWQVRLHIYLKRDADKEVVLNQLYKFSSLQTTFSMIFLALVGNRPQTLNIKELLLEFIRHRVEVIRRRTEFLLAEARKRKHTVEGLLIAQIDIDQVIQTIRHSPNRAEAKIRLQAIAMPAELVARALGERGFKDFQLEQGVQETYSLSANQTEAIVSMQLGSLANLERERLIDEHSRLIDDIEAHTFLLSDEAHIRTVVHTDMDDLKRKYSSKRRTEISDEELTDVNKDELITEETMVVTLSQRGYIKRTQLNTYKAQNRGGKGITGAKADEEDPANHLFVASTHDYLLFFTTFGKVYWQKVYDLPLQNRTAKGRALVNLLSLAEGETVANCVNLRFQVDDPRSLIMVTRKGTIKKTSVTAYSRPLKGGIIGIKLDDENQLIDVVIVSPGEDLVIATANGMSIRFSERDARSMGRNTMGVRGISLTKGDYVVGMVVANPDMTLLTVCENGYGKRTPFGYQEPLTDDVASPAETNGAEEDVAPEPVVEASDVEADTETPEEGDEAAARSNMQYRRQKRGGKGVRDIRTTARNGKVVDILPTNEGDEVLMISAIGKIQRVRAAEISQLGRNTQGVRIMSLTEGDRLVTMARIPAEIIEESDPTDINEDQ